LTRKEKEISKEKWLANFVGKERDRNRGKQRMDGHDMKKKGRKMLS